MESACGNIARPNILECMLARRNDCFSISLFNMKHKNKKRHDEYDHIFANDIMCCVYDRVIMA